MLTAGDWAARNIILAGSSVAVPGPLRPIAQQMAMLDVMGTPSSYPDRVTVMKSAQCGYSTCLLAFALYALVHQARLVGVYGLSATAVRGWMRTALIPALHMVPEAESMLEELNFRNDLTNDRVSIGGRTLHAMTAGSSRSTRQRQFDLALIDEIDAFKVSDIKEGDLVGLVARAILNSPFGKLVCGSTPVDMQSSQVFRQYNAATLRFRWQVPCPLCGHHDVLKFEYMQWDEPEPGAVDPLRSSADTARMQCQACKGEWAWPKLPRATEDGRWHDEEHGHTIRRNEGRSPDLLDANGKVVDFPRSVGFHMDRISAPFAPWSETVLEALKTARGSEAEQQRFTNLSLGLPFIPKGQARDLADMKLLQHEFELGPEVKLLTIGIDAQADRLSCLLVAFGPRQECWILRRWEHEGDMSNAGAGAYKDLADHIAKGVWVPKADGSPLKLHAIAIDGQHRASAIRGSRAMWRRVVKWVAVCNASNAVDAAEYVSWRRYPINPAAARMAKRQGGHYIGKTVPCVVLGAHQSKTHWFGRLQQPRYVHIHPDIPDDVMEELSSMYLEHHKTRSYWVKKGGIPSEAFDSLRYAGFAAWWRDADARYTPEDRELQKARWQRDHRSVDETHARHDTDRLLARRAM